jgi:hypothetical protein
VLRPPQQQQPQHAPPATPPMANPAVTPPSSPAATPQPESPWAPPQGGAPYGQPYGQHPYGQPPYGHSPYATPPAQPPHPGHATPGAMPPAHPPAYAPASPVAAGTRKSGAGRWIALVALLLLVAVAGAVVWRQRTGPEARMRRATELYSAGRTEAARGRFERIARDNPTMVEPHLYLARIAREQRDMTTARLELERALELDSRNATALREMGSVLFAEGNYELARRFYVRALQVAPEDRLAQGFLGCSLVRLGRVPEGERFIQRAGRGPWDGCAP